jgi:hypothetical protein
MDKNKYTYYSYSEEANMLSIQKRYVVDEHNNRLAVEIDYKSFTKIEEVLEDYALYQLTLETEESKSLSLKDAKSYYKKLLDNNKH